MKNTILILVILGIALTPTFVYPQTPLHIKKQNTQLTSFSYTMGDYDINQVNETRKNNGAVNLKRNTHLDSLALVRCKRMAEIIKRNPDLFCTDEKATFNIEGHRERTTPENTHMEFGGAGVTKEHIVTLKENDVATLLTGGFFGTYLAGPEYNDSKDHFKNRITPGYKEYGSCYLAVFVYAKNYNSDAGLKLEYIPTRVIIHYELFK